MLESLSNVSSAKFPAPSIYPWAIGNIGVHESPSSPSDNQNKTITVFDGDMDKVMASLIIANGAAAMCRKVTMFYTFWGLNALRKSNNVSSLEELMHSAMQSGVKMTACTMSMNVMGIKEEELIDGVELAGVATYLGDAELSNVNLFI